MLDQSKRDQLNQIIGRMKDNKEDDASIRAMVDQFKAKYDAPEAPAPTVDGGKPQAERSNIFPSASQIQGDGIGAKAARVALGAGDLMGVPMRAAASVMTDQKMSDPDAYTMKPLVEKFHSLGGQEAPDTRPANQPMFGNKVDFKDMARHLDSRSASGAGDAWAEIMGRISSDPVAWLGPIRQALGMVPGAVRNAGKAAGALNRGGGRLAEEMSGVSEEALRKAGTAQGREALAGAAGKESQIGHEFLDYVDNAHEYLPERAQVDEALKNMGPISTESATRALEGAKSGQVAGRSFGYQRAANDKIQGFADDLRGGAQPENLAATARDAERRAAEASGQAAGLGKEAAEEARLVKRAEKAQKDAQSELGKLGAEAANRVKHGTDFGWWHEETLTKAKEAAEKARDAAARARAQVAIGEATKAEYAAAKAAAESADKGHMVAEAASRIYRGENAKAVLGSISKDRGLGVKDLQEIFAKAKARAEGVPNLPDQYVSAEDYRKLRQSLDVNIDFNSEDGKLVNEALKTGRGTMKNELIKAARRSGNPDYEKWMLSWSDKLGKLDEIKKYIGQTGPARDKRIESFINNLFGKNSTHKQQLMADLDGIFGSGLTQKAKDAQLASQLGPEGKAGWMPRQFNGRSALGYVSGAGAATVTGNPLAAAAPALFASPKIASRFTLPMLTKTEEGLKAAGVALSPKANKLVMAMKRPIDDVQRARLASLLATEIEAQIPANIVPFRMKDVAEKEDNTRYSRQ